MTALPPGKGVRERLNCHKHTTQSLLFILTGMGPHPLLRKGLMKKVIMGLARYAGL